MRCPLKTAQGWSSISLSTTLLTHFPWKSRKSSFVSFGFFVRKNFTETRPSYLSPVKDEIKNYFRDTLMQSEHQVVLNILHQLAPLECLFTVEGHALVEVWIFKSGGLL